MSGTNSQSANALLSPLPSSAPDRRFSSQSNSNSNLNDENEWSDIPDIDSLKDEQKIIEKTLNSLLNFKVHAKTRGRPPNVPKVTQKIPDTVRDDFKSLSNINELHPGILMDYLTKVSSLNKKLLQNFELLTDKYIALNDKLSNSSTQLLVPNTLESPLHPQLPVLTSVGSKFEQNISNFNEDLFSKVDSLEQSSNACIVICSGENINDIASTDAPNMKNKLYTALKTVSPEITESDVDHVSVFGKHRKQLKVTCSNISVKNKLLRDIRTKKPTNFFISEGLCHDIFEGYKLGYE